MELLEDESVPDLVLSPRRSSHGHLPGRHVSPAALRRASRASNTPSRRNSIASSTDQCAGPNASPYAADHSPLPEREDAAAAQEDAKAKRIKVQGSKHGGETPPEPKFRIIDLPDRQRFPIPEPDQPYFTYVPRATDAGHAEYDLVCGAVICGLPLFYRRQDEEDTAWLSQLNEYRAENGLNAISEATLELIVDRFEKQSFLQIEEVSCNQFLRMLFQ